MTELFFRILEISITAGLVSLIVMVFRLVFKGAPRWVSCLLWALVALRLLCPFAIESRLSLMPDMSDLSESYVSQAEVVPAVAPVTQAGTQTQNTSAQMSQQEESSSVEIGRILALVWLGGMGGMLVYGGVSYLLTRKRVSDSVPYKDNIRQSEKINSPFILGVFRPSIYIPFRLKSETEKYVLAHEQAHLKRLDHIWKPMGFVLLCIHWFNPLMWVSYILLCRDVEVACDEKVISKYDFESRKNYASALLDCKVSYRMVSACPVAFGEVGVGERIRKTLRYKRTPAALIAGALLLVAVSAVCLLTDPVPEIPVAQSTVSDTQAESSKDNSAVQVLPEKSEPAKDSENSEPEQIEKETVPYGQTQAEYVSDGSAQQPESVIQQTGANNTPAQNAQQGNSQTTVNTPEPTPEPTPESTPVVTPEPEVVPVPDSPAQEEQNKEEDNVVQTPVEVPDNNTQQLQSISVPTLKMDVEEHLDSSNSKLFESKLTHVIDVDSLEYNDTGYVYWE